MSDKFEAQGLLRVRSAINRRDTAAVELATIQFLGTSAADEAHRWLGDMHLATGRFDQAEQHFQAGLMSANEVKRRLLEPRLILTQALAGKLTSLQLDAAIGALSLPIVEFNGRAIPVEEFRSMIRQLASRPAPTDLLTESAEPAAARFPIANCQLTHRAGFEGDAGANVGLGENRSSDPVGRQMATASDDKRIYISNRFQVSCYSLPDGKLSWTEGLEAEQGDAQAMPLTPMKPLVIGERLFVRRLTKTGVELACLKTDSGELIWRRRHVHGVLADPHVWNGRLFTLLLTKLEDEQSQVEAAWFDPLTGLAVSTHPLFRLRDSSDQPTIAQLTVTDRNAVCTVSGTTACFDWQGQVCWLRRHILMRKPVDELADDFRLARPVMTGSTVIVTMPGVRELCCLDLETGRAVWRQPITNLRGMLNVIAQAVIVDTVSGFEGFRVDTGERLWRTRMADRLEAIAVDENSLIVSQRATSPDQLNRPVLMRLDSNTGERGGQVELNEPRKDLQFGPLFSAGGKWWVLVGRSRKDPGRELHQFVVDPSSTAN